MVQKIVENISKPVSNKPVAIYPINRLIGVLLIFCVCSSKHFLIYNEEVLVACSFLLFCWVFYSSFSDSITQSLNSRSENIKMELQNFLRLKQDFQSELIKEHQTMYNCSICLSQMAKFFNIKFHDALNLSTKYGHETTKFLVLEKFNTCSQLSSHQTRELQTAMIDHFRESLSMKFAAGYLKQKALSEAKSQLNALARSRLVGARSAE